MSIKRIAGSALFLVVVLGSVGCHKAKKYDATVEVTRISVVRRDANARALTTDLEFSYFECPGTQIETVRGGEEFSKCVSKLAVGAKVPVKVDHRYSDAQGHWVWEVHQIADCTRPVDPNDEASFALVRECEDWTVNGAKVGFQCDIKPKKELIKKCPWFARH
jgi:hypothetical protein